MKMAHYLFMLGGLFIAVLSQSAMAFIVFDPTNFAKNALTALHTAQQLETQSKQLNAELADMKNYDGNIGKWGNAAHLLDQLAREVDQGQALSYHMQGLDQQYRTQFPGYVASNDYPVAYQHWTEATQDTLRSTLLSAGLQANYFSDEQADFNQLSRLSETATGRMQAIQIGNRIATQQLSQLQLLRQLVITQINAQNTYEANQIQQKAAVEASASQWIRSSKVDFPAYSQHENSSNILTHITQSYLLASKGWHATLFPIAKHVFGLLATIEIAWSGLLWAMNRQEVESLWTEFLKKMLSIGFFYTLLIYANEWLPSIIQSFVQIGAGASGLTGLYPSDILDQGISVATSVIQPLLDAGLLHAGIGYLIGGVASLVVLISFALIAAELVVTLIESYIVVSAGILLLGFSANRFTAQYSSKYLSYAMSVGVKLFVLYLIIGVGSTLATHWGDLVVQGGIKNMAPFMEVMGGALVFLYVAKNIPNKAESLLSGSVNLSGGGLAAVATGAALLALRSTVNAGSSGMEAVKQASMVSGHHNHSAMGMVKGAVTAGANLVSSAIGHGAGLRTMASGMASKTQGLDRALAEKSFARAVEQPLDASKKSSSTTDTRGQHAEAQEARGQHEKSK